MDIQIQLAAAGDEAVIAWIAYTAALPIGYATVEAKYRKGNVFRTELGWWEVDQVAVLNEYQGYGVASALMEAVVATAASAGIEELQLSTWEFNAQARTAFEHLGFAPLQHRFVRRLGPSGQ